MHTIGCDENSRCSFKGDTRKMRIESTHIWQSLKIFSYRFSTVVKETPSFSPIFTLDAAGQFLSLYIFQSSSSQLCGLCNSESHDLEQVFLGEFFWFSAYGNSSEFSGYSRWTRGDNERIPKDVLVTADGYSSKQGDYDCSLDESIHMYLPAGWLIRHIGLRWNGVEEQFFDENGKGKPPCHATFSNFKRRIGEDTQLAAALTAVSMGYPEHMRKISLFR